MQKLLQLFTAAVLGTLASTAHATLMPIDLTDFFADPTVAVAVDGSSALMEEDPFFSPVLLSNDPGLGDANVIIPGIGTILSFDFDFMEAAGEDDVFIAFVLDAATGLSLGAGFEFSTASSSAANVAFDLTSLVGLTLGLQFELGANFGDTGFDSTVLISAVQLEQVARAVPEPGVLLLMATAMLLMMTFQRRRRVCCRGMTTRRLTIGQSQLD